jgi:hypothetical protein
MGLVSLVLKFIVYYFGQGVKQKVQIQLKQWSKEEIKKAVIKNFDTRSREIER